MRKIILFITLFLASNVGLAQDGALDMDFNSGIGFNGSISRILLQPDDKILAFGAFSSYNNVTRNGIARINSDGSLDTSFSYNANGWISDAILQPDGKIIISERVGSSFNFQISRLNPNGSVDPNFNIGIIAGGIYSLGMQSDGKIIISGNFNNFGFNSVTNLARLNSNGSFDSTFSSAVVANFFNNSHSAHAIFVQPDDKIIINTTGIKLVRLNPNGSLDTGFNAPDETYAYKFLLQTDGKIVFSKQIDFAFPPINALYQIARLNTDGSFDTTFGSPFLDEMEYNIDCIALQSDGKILIGGDFNYGTSNAKMLARLNPNGTLDNSFQTGTGPNHRVSEIVFKTNGKVIIGGTFTEYNGVPRNYIARLNNSLLGSSFFEDGEKISVYPNPASNLIQVKLNNDVSFFNFEIYDVNSRKIKASQSSNKAININDLEAGIFFLKVKTDGGFFSSKFIKE